VTTQNTSTQSAPAQYWRLAFRLHALDLNVIEAAESHEAAQWVLDEPLLAKMAQAVERDCLDALRAGATADLPRSAGEFLGRLTFVTACPPAGLFDQAAFTLCFALACARQSAAAFGALRAATAKRRRSARTRG
jgi:hypothetical protein